MSGPTAICHNSLSQQPLRGLKPAAVLNGSGYFHIFCVCDVGYGLLARFLCFAGL
jgi:hypothetical protein